jgi:hypothetical protein
MSHPSNSFSPGEYPMLKIHDPNRDDDELNDDEVVFSVTLGHISQFLEDQEWPPLTQDERDALTFMFWQEADDYGLIGDVIHKLREDNCIVAGSASA